MAVKTMAQVAKMLVKARTKKKLSLREVARRSGISVASLSKLESGAVDNPTLATMVAVNGVYGLTLLDWV